MCLVTHLPLATKSGKILRDGAFLGGNVGSIAELEHFYVYVSSIWALVWASAKSRPRSSDTNTVFMADYAAVDCAGAGQPWIPKRRSGRENCKRMLELDLMSRPPIHHLPACLSKRANIATPNLLSIYLMTTAPPTSHADGRSRDTKAAGGQPE